MQIEEAGNQPSAGFTGFAARVPADASMYLAVHGAGGAMRDWLDGLPSEDMDAGTSPEEFTERVGDEHFMFIGAGAGELIGMALHHYNRFSALLTGYAAGGMLDYLAKPDPDKATPEFDDMFSWDLAEQWLDVLLNDKQLRMPSLVLGWQPDESRLSECLGRCRDLIGGEFRESTDAVALEFEAYGGNFEGYRIPGHALFGKWLDDAETGLADKLPRDSSRPSVSPEEVERLLSALRNMQFTVASGCVDGRVLLYMGNGPVGFLLAEDAAQSLAASDALAWTRRLPDRHRRAEFYLSDPMVRSVLPLLDSSPHWKSLAGAVRAPVRDPRAFRQVLTAMSDQSATLAKREASALSTVLLEDDGYRLESCGGWLNPGLDYDAPLRMEAAVMSDKPAIRAHWVRNRARKQAEWKQLESLGVLLEMTLNEVMDSTYGAFLAGAAGPDVRRPLLDDLRELNRNLRDEFRAGVGDEVALIADLRGDVPALPGIETETVRRFKAPRLIVARPVVDRTKIDAAGTSLAQSMRDLTTWAGGVSGEDMPLILPHSIETENWITWYLPTPFIGGDFVPGIGLNDRMWTIGTSPSLASGFARACESASHVVTTGVVIDVDLAAWRDWCMEIYRHNETEARMMVDQSLAELGDSIEVPSEIPGASEWFERLDSLHYRHWKEDGKARRSLHLRITPAAERGNDVED